MVFSPFPFLPHHFTHLPVTLRFVSCSNISVFHTSIEVIIN